MNALNKDTSFVIIEDETTSALLLRDFLDELGYQNVNIFKEALAGMEALEIIKPNVLFLDVNLNGEYSGVDILKFIDSHKIHTHVIITTAFINYTVDVIRYSIIDFLVKPIQLDELEQALNKVAHHCNTHEKLNAPLKEKKIDLIEIHSNQEINYFLPNDVIYLEAEGSYTHIFLTNDRKNTVSQNLGKLATYFPADQFVRVGRKNIINLLYLKKLCKKSHNLILEYNDQRIEIAVSKNYLPKTLS